MYRLDPGLSTTSKNLFNRANFARLGKREEASENFYQWYVNKTWYNFQEDPVYSLLNKSQKKPRLFSLLQYSVAFNVSIILFFISTRRFLLKSNPLKISRNIHGETVLYLTSVNNHSANRLFLHLQIHT